MNNLVQSGNRIDWVNTTGSLVTSGSVVVLVSGASGKLAIAVTDIAVNATGEVCLGGYPEGVFSLAKHSGEAFTALQAVFWDGTNHRLTATSTGNTRAGRVTLAYASAAVLANLKLNEG